MSGDIPALENWHIFTIVQVILETEHVKKLSGKLKPELAIVLFEY